ncbi:MAG: SPOR domain-containing protein [Blastocatellia bacterium]|nr:SPOR domain-containing protein [Blastocatellia bacterium]
MYATRIGDEFDDVLDIPRPAQNEYAERADSSQVFEDVFSPTQTYDSTANYDFPSYEKNPTAPVSGFQTDTTRQRVTQDYSSPAEPEFMGWPVLPENSIEDEESIGGFAANKGSVFARVGLIVLAFGVLSFLAYYFLWDLIAKRKEVGSITAGATVAQNPGPVQSVPPVSVPSVESRVVTPSPIADAPRTVSTPPVVEPKPEAPAAAKPGTEVKIAPMQGNAGHSQSPKPAPPVAAAPAVPATPNRGNLTIQVGSFPDAAQANDRVGRLRGAGVDARVVRADLPGKGTWYRVQIGGFGSREEAQGYAGQLRSKGVVQDFIVVTVGK